MHCAYRGMPKGMYPAEAMSNSEKIKPAALAVIELHLGTSLLCSFFNLLCYAALLKFPLLCSLYFIVLNDFMMICRAGGSIKLLVRQSYQNNFVMVNFHGYFTVTVKYWSGSTSPSPDDVCYIQ